MMLQTPPALEPEQTPLQMLQQQTVEQPQSLEPTAETGAMTSSAENSLLLQIQALTEQLLASTAVNSSLFGFYLPQTEIASDSEVICSL